MESGRTSSPVTSESQWNPDAFADRDWLIIAAQRLTAVTRAVANAESFSELLRVVTEACVGIGDAEAAGIYLLQTDQRSFTVGWEATSPDWPRVRPAGDLLALQDWHGMVRARDLGLPTAWQIDDPFLSPFERRHYLAENVGSGIDVPLVCRGETLGFLKLFRRHPDHWSARDITIASMIGASIALALSSERLLQSARQHSIDQSALANLAQVAITPREPRDLLQRVAEQIRNLLPFPCVDIELWSTELDRAEIVAHSAIEGWPGPTNGIVFYQLSSWPSDLRLLRELAMFTQDLDDELPDVERRYFEARNLVQLHYVPLVYGERCLGAIILQTDVRVPLDHHLVSLINEIAAITTLAAHAARKHRDTAWERRAQDWQLRVNRMLLNEAPIEAVLDEALASLIDMTTAALAFIDIHEPGSRESLARRNARIGVSPLIEDLEINPEHWPIVDEAVQRRQLRAERVSDQSIDPDLVAALVEFGLESVIAAPVIHDGRLCGTLTMLCKRGFMAGDDEIEFIRQLARQLALVATSHHLMIEQEFVARRSAIMLRVSRAAVSISDPALLLRDIAESALEMDDVDGCEIERYDPENGLVHNDTIAFAGPWRYQYNPTISHQLVDIPTFANAIHRDGATTYLMSDPHVTPYERDAFRAIGIESVLVIPLTYEGETLGVLTLLRCQPVRFAARTEALANELATHASLALGRARLFETLRSRADSDGVTGLANHRAILERIDTGLQQIESTNGSLSLLLIDLDRFKQLNDARGHLTGDRYLREVANLIRDSIGERGIAARYGGDEFLVLLHDCDVEECSAIADELIETCRNATFTLDGETVSCGFSVGTATAPLHGRTRDALIGHADRGMYDAKQHGGGRIGHTK